MTLSISPGARPLLSKALRAFLMPVLKKGRDTHLPVYLVGGCVRDLMLKREPLDIDIVVEGPSDLFVRAAAKHFRAKVVTHPQFLTHTLKLPNGRHVDIATARTETYPESAALPVVEPASLQDDLYRRDFSINAMALSLNEGDFGHLWDPFGGADDLNSKIIRVLHAASFKDDPTRVFRAARFVSRFGAELEWRTREWLTESIQQQRPSKLSGARLREELLPLLSEQDPRVPLRLLAKWNALEFLAPGVHWSAAHETLFGHVLKAKTVEPILLRLMALLHSAPLPKAVGALSHLMFPQATISQVEDALQVLSQLRHGALKGALASQGRKKLSGTVKQFLELALRVKGLLRAKKPLEQWQRFEDSAPCLSGQDLRDLGYRAGPGFRQMFDAIRQARWEGKLRSREQEIQFLLRTFPVAKAG